MGTNWASNPLHFERFCLCKNDQKEHRPLSKGLCHCFGDTRVSPQLSLTKRMHRLLKIRYLVKNPAFIKTGQSPKMCVKIVHVITLLVIWLTKKSSQNQGVVLTCPLWPGSLWEYGKCVPVKYSVKVPPSTVSLKNKFQCLQDLCDSQDIKIHDQVHTTESEVNHSDVIGKIIGDPMKL